ncbi:hypothetical protein ACFFU1_00975 [Algibacter miyuki]|uniref:Secretion system C-terminal sorting domain-containing protein n=1 Tax=Algibacter miyuki TaxID=1306933 RepID=A0ABV5GV44_9FLAO|nr:hypothetical protein [Algibacter miyuki]MDN3664782.1 hypothetical protein [Algibacter miyuki]
MKDAIIISKKIVLTATLCAGLLANAGTNNNIFDKRDVVKTALTINNVKEGNVLSIKDNYGTTLYKEFIEASGTYNKGFDLTALPNGDYVFEINKDVEIKIIPFTVISNEVVFNKAAEVTVFKPTVRMENNFLFISQLSLNASPLEIEIYADVNGSYELLHSDKTENAQIIEKTFKLEKGNYKIKINSENQEYTKFINN